MNRIEKKIPNCIGIIMDGNRRWAKEKSLLSLEGHKAGYEKLKDVILWSKEAEVKNLVVYAFSSENWRRSEKEVAYLLELFKVAISEFINSMEKEKARIKFIGNVERFPKNLRDNMKKLEEESKKYKDINLYVALSYGGREEIVNAVKSMLKESESKKTEITENSFSEHLWTKDMPDPDLIIRTGGEKRLSNFLLWQSAYSELFFTETLWPDFSEEEFNGILSDFFNRERRFGK